MHIGYIEIDCVILDMVNSFRSRVDHYKANYFYLDFRIFMILNRPLVEKKRGSFAEELNLVKLDVLIECFNRMFPNLRRPYLPGRSDKKNQWTTLVRFWSNLSHNQR